MKKTENNNSKKKYLFFGIGIIITIALIVILAICLKDKSIAKIKLDVRKDDIYQWECEIKDKKIVKLDKKEKVGEDSNKGDMITEVYTFKALKPGKTTITFTFVNINNKSYLNVKNYKVVVDKKNHITIEEKS